MSFLYVQAVEHRKSEVQQHARDLAAVASVMIDLELHESLVGKEQQGSDVYQRAISPLVAFQLAHSSIQYVWTVRVSAEDEQRLVLLTSTDTRVREQQRSLGREQVDIPFLGPNTETPEGAKSVPILRQGQAFVFPGIYTDQFDSYIEARAPLITAAGDFVGYIGIDYALDRYTQQIDEVRRTGGISLLLAFGLSILLTRTAYRVSQQRQVNLRDAEAQRDLAREANEAKSELLRVATHDLKNPLSAIAGMSGLLLRRRAKEVAAPDRALQEAYEVLETVQVSSQHMSDIVRDILVNEGLGHGDLQFQQEPVDVAQLSRDILQFNTPTATRKNITLETEISSPLPATVVPRMIREAFDNFVSNAVKYSPPDQKVWIRLAPVSGTDQFEFSVRDEGPGLSVEDQAKLFGKFQKLTPRPTAGESSTGLGLSIVKTVAELHHGEVGCDSELGQGTRFWIRLPTSPPQGNET